jgi:hypothetical protein
MAGIKIPVGTDNTGLNAGVAAAQKKLQKFKSFAGGVFAAVGIAAGMTAGLKSFADRLDRIQKLSSRDLDTTFLQQLEYLAALSGTNLEMAANAVSKFVKEIRSAAGPSAEISASLKALGLDIGDLKRLDPQQLFLQVATRIGELDNEGDQLAATTALLGTRYAELLPLIQGLSQQGLPDLNTATNATIEKTAVLNDQLTKIKFAFMNGLVEPIGWVIKSLASLVRYIAIAGEQATYLFIQIYTGGRQVVQVLEGILSLDSNQIKSGLQGVRREYDLFFSDLKRAYAEGMEDIDSFWEAPEAKSRTGDRKYDPESENQDVIGDEGREAIASYNKIAAERRRKVAAEQRSLGSIVASLEEQGRSIVSDVLNRRAESRNPQNFTASTMRSVGGGGGVSSPNEMKVLRVNERQLTKLGAIEQELKAMRLRQSNGTVPFK